MRRKPQGHPWDAASLVRRAGVAPADGGGIEASGAQALTVAAWVICVVGVVVDGAKK